MNNTGPSGGFRPFRYAQPQVHDQRRGQAPYLCSYRRRVSVIRALPSFLGFRSSKLRVGSSCQWCCTTGTWPRSQVHPVARGGTIAPPERRRSRQNGWLGTRVRESQMTCVCVRVTTSSEVVHRKHRDEKRSAKEHENQKSV